MEFLGVDNEMNMLDTFKYAQETLKSDPNSVVELDMGKDNGGDSQGESSEDFKERLVDVPFVNCNSEPDEERDHARDNVSKYVQLKKSI